MEMSKVHFREFINERLAAIAEEIFGAFRKTMVEYEDEIERQRRMLQTFCKPEIRLHRIGVYTQIQRHAESGWIFNSCVCLFFFFSEISLQTLRTPGYTS